MKTRLTWCLGTLCALLMSVGCSQENNDAMYRITGNVSALSEEAEIRFRTVRYDAEGSSRLEEVKAKTKDGHFEIYGIVWAPQVVTVATVIDGDMTVDSVQVVLEPGARIHLTHFGAIGMYASGDGLHGELIDSWAFHPDYVAHRNEYSYKSAELVTLRERLAGKTADETDNADEDAAEEEMVVDAGEAAEQEAVATVDDGGSVASDPELTVAELEAKIDELQQEVFAAYRGMNAVKEEVLAEKTLESSEIALLALELNALRGKRERLTRFEELAELLPEQTVAARITPRLDLERTYIETVENEERLVAGVIAPDFTTTDFIGESVGLHETLASREVALIDFWASWCGPCIKTFPELKEIHAEFRERGFEVIAVSIDEEREDWEEATAEHELPWLNWGDIGKAFGGEIAQTYGVKFIPKAYLVNTEGEILAKDLPMPKLAEFLTAHFEADEQGGDSVASEIADPADAETEGV